MNTFKTVGVVVATLLVVTTFAPAYAQTDEGDNTIAQLTAQIEALLKQVQELQAEVTSLRGEQQEVRTELSVVRDEFRSYLREGLQSDEVKALQEFLASDPTLYPEGIISGYFGPLTAKAIKRFQARHGVEQVGVVGPKTRAKLNELLSNGAGNSGKIPFGIAKKHNDDDGVDDNDEHRVSTTTPELGKAILCHNASKKNSHTITVSYSALSAHLNHGDLVGKCEHEDESDEDNDESDDGNESDENDNDDNAPDITSPIISNLHATSTATTTTSIKWVTDENANSMLWYGTTTPATIENSLHFASHGDFVLEHSFDLSGLTASTTYYYFARSSDEAGNTATSSEQMFTTTE